MKKSKQMCAGCYNDQYNYGLGGAKECWSYNTASVKFRKAVHINQMPPWKQDSQQMLSCYHRPQWCYIDENTDR